MIDISPNFSGEWFLEVVNASGESYFPFGKEFRKNMLLNNGLKKILEASYTSVGPYQTGVDFNYQTIPSFIKGGASIGNGTSIPLITNIGLDNILQTTTTLLSNHREYFCRYEDDLVKGTRSYIRIFEFSAVSENTTFTEGGIYSSTCGDTYYSRFLFPASVILGAGQYIRLAYKFIVGIPAIVTPINISITPNGSFNPSGQIKLVGKFNDIFGAMNSSGLPITEVGGGDTPRSSIIPFCEDFFPQVGSTVAKISPSAFLLTSDQALNVSSFPSINQALVTGWVGNRLSVDNSSIIVSAYSGENLYRDCTYIFDQGNPYDDSGGVLVGGILFTNGQTASYESGQDRNITWDGWLWKFNVPQLKSNLKKITIVLRSSVSRTV